MKTAFDLYETRTMRRLALFACLGIPAGFLIGVIVNAPFVDRVYQVMESAFGSVGLAVLAFCIALMVVAGADIYRDPTALVETRIRFREHDATSSVSLKGPARPPAHNATAMRTDE